MIENVSDTTAFAVGAAILAWLSRKPLRVPGSHGFYRFFGWLAILGLVVLNRKPWGEDPLSPHQLASWVFLITSVALVSAGIHAIRRGAASATRGDPSLYDFESTTALVSDGIFRHIRHPMYSSLLFLTWGAFLQAPSLVGLATAVFGSLCFFLTALADERECLRYFGPAYAEYMTKTQRFIPRVF